ncbi:MAG: undecaprenyl-diphosphatase [Planctomycetota bacterium]
MLAELAGELTGQAVDPELFARYAVLAVVQGLTEFLPVSSSGHLVLTQSMMEVESAPLAVDIALHLGTLAAVLLVYRKSITDLLRGMFRGQFAEVLLLALATAPVAVIGLLFKDQIETAFSDPKLTACALIGTALILAIGEVGRRKRIRGQAAQESEVEPEVRLNLRQAILIGTAQCLALLPGISRSGTTIAAGILVGLPPAYAARVSFLLSIPAIAGAAVLKMPELLNAADGGGSTIAGAMVIAAIVGWVALRFLLRFISRGAFVWFAIYCGALGSGYLLFV